MGLKESDLKSDVLAIITGAVVGVIVFIPIFIVALLFMGLIPFGDNETANKLTYIVGIVVIIISSYFAGYITGILSQRNNLLNSSITGILLSLVYCFSTDFRINDTLYFWIAVLIIPPSTVAGAYYPKEKKKHH